jgi:hypothetical protein
MIPAEGLLAGLGLVPPPIGYAPPGLPGGWGAARTVAVAG